MEARHRIIDLIHGARHSIAQAADAYAQSLRVSLEG